MKTIAFILIITITGFTSCQLITMITTKTEEVKRLVEQKDECYWKGTFNEIDYLLTIDSVKEIWFRGKIIIDNSDTLFLGGFEKGNNHPTHYKKNLNDTTEIGYIFIWAVGNYADTVKIINKSGIYDAIPENLTLIKYKKNLNYFESQTMRRGEYIEGQVSKLINYNESETKLKITLCEKVSEDFIQQFFDQTEIDDYLVGDYETDLRLKIAIQKYGILTSETYKGKINYDQLKKPKSKKIKDKIHFLSNGDKK